MYLSMWFLKKLSFPMLYQTIAFLLILMLILTLLPPYTLSLLFNFVGFRINLNELVIRVLITINELAVVGT